ncbi:hypothetical protein [Taibaiella helva]|uniref:hypothetical protein n=1 Tax=Taibaiella helva TaxID=2301235 RepID=UPI000E570E1F|nr:hypothetical protein [Taibaiella helva]
MSLAVTYTEATLTAHFKKLCLINLIFIIFADAYIVYFLGGPGLMLMNLAKVINVVFFIYLVLRKNQKATTVLTALLFIPFCWMYLFQDSLFTGIMKSYARILPGLTFLYLDDNDKKYVARLFIKGLYYSLIPALIVYPFVLLKINLPGFMMAHPRDGRMYKVTFGIVFNLVYVPQRIHGLFDEPGVTGTFCAFALFFFFPVLTRWQKRVFFLAGLFSWSMFFIVIVTPIYLYHLWKGGNKAVAGALSLIILAAAVGFLIWANQAITRLTKHDFLYAQVLGRLKTNEQGQIVGVIDNRDASWIFTQRIYEPFVKEGGPKYYLGSYFFGDYTGDKYPALSQRLFIFNYGFGLLLYVYFFFLVTLPVKKRSELLVVMLFLGLGFYQRPQLFRAEYLTLIYGGILLSNEYRKKLIASRT